MENITENKVLAIYDTVTERYEGIAVIPKNITNHYWTEIASNVESKYYQNIDDYIAFELGTFDDKKGDFNLQMKKIGNLKNFQDKDRVKYQRMIQTLNFLPTGYFRMPKEMQDEINENIKKAQEEYIKALTDKQ